LDKAEVSLYLIETETGNVKLYIKGFVYARMLLKNANEWINQSKATTGSGIDTHVQILGLEGFFFFLGLNPGLVQAKHMPYN
jgi:hypothetical protein